jgi:hypothetical protein
MSSILRADATSENERTGADSRAEKSASTQEQAPLQKSIPNGGLEAWMAVAAVFGVFVNSWYVHQEILS